MESKKSEVHTDAQKRSRRTFVKKTLVGSALISLPTKGVWATGQVNVNSSAAASGNGSDAGNVNDYSLKGPDYWRYNCSYDYKYKKFESVFGVEAYRGKASETGPRYEYGSVKTFNKSLIDILTPSRSSYAGCNNYNRLLIAMFLNAAQSGDGDCYYPILEGNQFYSEYDFANFLVSNTYSDPYGSSFVLAQYIANPSQTSW